MSDVIKARLYVPDDLTVGSSITLAEDQAHYLRHVLRLEQGASVALFNGRDGEMRARLSEVSKKACRLTVEAQLRPQIPADDVWLCFAPIKQGRIEMIVEKATGASWQQAVHERIVEPLGLKETILTGTSTYLPSPSLVPHKRLRPGGPQVDVSTYVAGHGDASIISTTSDVNRFLSALLGGRLLKPAQLAEMQKTEPAAPYEIVYDEPGYGLGLMKRRTSCGEVWFHGGGYLNAITDNAVTSDGRRAVTVAIASSVEPGQFPIEQYKASAALIDHAICGTR